MCRHLLQHNVPKELVGIEKWSVTSEDEDEHKDPHECHSLPGFSPQHGTLLKKEHNSFSSLLKHREKAKSEL